MDTLPVPNPAGDQQSSEPAVSTAPVPSPSSSAGSQSGLSETPNAPSAPEDPTTEDTADRPRPPTQGRPWWKRCCLFPQRAEQTAAMPSSSRASPMPPDEAMETVVEPSPPAVVEPVPSGSSSPPLPTIEPQGSSTNSPLSDPFSNSAAEVRAGRSWWRGCSQCFHSPATAPVEEPSTVHALGNTVPETANALGNDVETPPAPKTADSLETSDSVRTLSIMINIANRMESNLGCSRAARACLLSKGAEFENPLDSAASPRSRGNRCADEGDNARA